LVGLGRDQVHVVAGTGAQPPVPVILLAACWLLLCQAKNEPTGVEIKLGPGGTSIEMK
jgi:hypothetical protein